MEEAGAERDGLDSAQVRTLTEIGMMAAGHGLATQAEEIFEALAVVRPDRPFPYIGMAVALMNAGRAEDAVAVLERRGLAACPGDAQLRAFLGLALQLAQRRADSRRVLEALMQEQPDGEAAKLARELLDAA